MKNRFLLLAVCGSMLLLSGCWDRIEINDLAIITATAIDKRGKNIEVSVQVFLPKTSSSGGAQSGSSSSEPNTIVRSEQGYNLADALSKLQGDLPRKLFWGQCKVFIFGEKLAKEGVREHMDFLLRHPQPRERAYMFVGKGPARKYIEFIPPLERSSSEVIREITKARIGMDVTMVDLDEMLMGPSHAAALPYLRAITHKQISKKTDVLPKIDGTAIFRKDRMVGTITEQQTRGIIWLKNKIKGYTVNVKPANTSGGVSLDPVSASVKLIPIIQNGEWKMNVKVNTEGTVVQNRTSYSISDPQFQKIVEQAYKEAIKKRIYHALQPLQQRMKADIAGFADEFYRKYPRQFKRVENHWEEVFPNVKVNLDVTAHIRRQGLITEPGSLPEKEVKEK